MQQRENGMTSYDFDLITLGAGSGGVRASRLAGSYGAKVAVVEKSRVGGTCVMRGCVPKKLLVYASQFSDAFEDSLGFGWRPGPADFDWPVLISAKNLELKRLEGVYQRILRDNGVTLIEGQGVLLDPHTALLEPANQVRSKEPVECLPHKVLSSRIPIGHLGYIE